MRHATNGSELAHLREDLETLAGRLSRLGGRTLGEGRNRAAADLESLQEAVHDALDRIGGHGRRATERVSETVQEHPIALLSAAFAAGALLAVALRQRH
jgi:ElaB/YqjD/DUF883 family membrane-anchored ribosome-binding protein